MPTPRTVAFINHVGLISGAEQSLLILLANLDHARYQPILLCPPGPLAEQARALDVVWRPWCGARLRRDLAALPQLLCASLALRPLLAEADLIHANSLSAALAAWPQRGCRPLLWHVRDLHLPALPARIMARRADACLAISNAVVDRLRRLGAPAERLHLLPNALDPATFQPSRARAEVRAELGLDGSQPVAIVVGQLVPWKGHGDLLAAWAQVRRAWPEAQLLVAGSDLFGEHADHVAALREQADRAGGVRWLGARSDIADLLAASDLLVLPSHNEPFGRVLLEAAAVGLPVVATWPGGPADVVDAGRTGWLVPAGQPAVMAEAIGRAFGLTEPARESMGRAARARLERLFRPDQQAERLAAVYSRLSTGESP